MHQLALADRGNGRRILHGLSALPWPQFLRPVDSATRPRRRPLVQHGPQIDHDDLDVKDSCPASKVPSGQSTWRFRTISTKVCVPWLISLKKVHYDKHVRKLTHLSSPPAANASWCIMLHVYRGHSRGISVKVSLPAGFFCAQNDAALASRKENCRRGANSQVA